MKDFINDELSDWDLNLTPIMKKLISSYVSNKYEGDADLSNHSLIREWKFLVDNNQVLELFVDEWVHNKRH